MGDVVDKRAGFGLSQMVNQMRRASGDLLPDKEGELLQMKKRKSPAAQDLGVE